MIDILLLVLCMGTNTAVFAEETVQSNEKTVVVSEWPSLEQLTEQTTEGFNVLGKNYISRQGTWRETGWWNSANILTVMIRFSKLSVSRDYLPTIENTFQRAKRNSFLNEYYDDEAWWALAWVEAYELTENKDYLDMAELIFRDIADSWDDLHGGGVYWKKGSVYKNSIANNLFCLLALRLNAHLPETQYQDLTYRQWAEREWEWYSKTGMLNKSIWLIEDGLRRNGTPNVNQHWTYNQGVTIAVLVEFHRLNGDAGHLEMAKNIADATMQRMTTPEGILKERNEPNPGADGSQFKGIFMRHLYTLYKETHEERYKDFVLKNTASILKHRNEQTGRFGVTWGLNTGISDMGAHGSALDCLVSAIGLQNNQKK